MSQSRYRHGKIYKIVSNKTGLVYIGSTCKTLPQRIAQHERDYKQYQKTGKKYNIYMTSFKILKHGNYQIQLVEKGPSKKDHRGQPLPMINSFLPYHHQVLVSIANE